MFDFSYPKGYNVKITHTIQIYVTDNDKAPFIEWLESLDKMIRYRVKERLDRLALGNPGDHKKLNANISELRLKFGAGYRIYYAEEYYQTVLVLCGGNKSSQSKDIKQAQLYWNHYRETKHEKLH